MFTDVYTYKTMVFEHNAVFYVVDKSRLVFSFVIAVFRENKLRYIIQIHILILRYVKWMEKK